MTYAPLRYIRSRDCQTQILAPLPDSLHAKVWGFMSYSNHPFDDVPIVETADPMAWVLASRQQQPPKATRVPYDYRTDKDWFAIAADITDGSHPALAGVDV